MLFDRVPISVWLEDFSEVKRIRDRLSAEGVTDFRLHLEADPELVRACLQAVRILAVNQEALRLHDTTSREGLLAGLENTFTDQSLVDFREELIALFGGEHTVKRETELKTIGGESRDVLVSVSLDSRHADWSRVMVVIVDITQRKRAERDLRFKEGLLAETARIGKIGGWSLDAATRSMSWTDEVFSIFGLEPGAVPSLEVFLAAYPPLARETLQTAVQRCLEHGVSYDLELPFVDTQGRQRWTRSVAHAELLNESVVRLNGALQDVTARRLEEDRRRELEAEIQRSQKLKSLGVLAGGIAHDFNNLLTVVLGHAELALLKGAKNCSSCGDMIEIERAARCAVGLAGQMLACAGRGEFTHETVDLEAFASEMLAMLRVAIAPNTALQLTRDPSLPHIETDPNQLRQILLNLVMNASEALAGREGRLAVHMGQTRRSAHELERLEQRYPVGHETPLPGREYISIEVRDDGTGMTPEVLRQIFDPFFSTKFTGRGLGMASVAGILRSGRGAIDIDSKPGRGTCVQVYLPFTKAAPDTREPEPTNSTTDLAGDPGRFSGRVLLADDEPGVLAITGKMLRRLGFEVTPACDGREALERFNAEKNQFRLGVFDLTMPHMNGIELFEQVQRSAPSMPVVLSTGYREESLESTLGAHKPAGFLRKPFNLSELERVISQALQKPLG